MSDQRVSKIVDEAFSLESKSNSPIEIDKNLLEDIIGTVTQPENPTEPLDQTKEDHVVAEKTNEVDNSDQTNSKKSRELKLLLALSKEANLNTNILHKRNSLEGNKTKAKDQPKLFNSPSESESKGIPKVAQENRGFRYPVTAESELELDISEGDKKCPGDNSSKVSKRKRDDLNEVSPGGATEESARKNKKPLSTNMDRFKVICSFFHQICLKKS